MMPLLLCQSGIQSAILKLISQHSELVPTDYVHWLKSEFDNLVASATQEAAAMSDGSTATSFDEWDYLQEGMSFLSGRSTKRKAPFQEDTPILGRCTARRDAETSPRKRLKSNETQSFFFDLAVGRLQVTVPCRSTTSEKRSSYHEASQVGFSFMPKTEICSTFLAGKFAKVIDAELEPRLYVQLNAFVLSQISELHLDLLSYGTVQDVDSALRAGKISLYELDEYHGNICFFVRDPSS